MPNLLENNTPTKTKRAPIWDQILSDILEYAEMPGLAGKRVSEIGINLATSKTTDTLPLRSRGWILNLHDRKAGSLTTAFSGPIYWVSLAHPSTIAGSLANDPQGAWWTNRRELTVHADEHFDIFRMKAWWGEPTPQTRLHLAAGILAARLLGVPPMDIQLWAENNH